MAALLLAVQLLGLEAMAQVLSDAAGVWNNVAISTPSSLTYHTDTEGRLTWVENLNGFDTWQAAITVNQQGQFSGPVTGTIAVAGPGLIRVSVPDEPPASFFLNSRGDFMVSAKLSRDDERHDLELLLKAPPNLAPADLAGQWRGFNLVTPTKIDLILNQSLVVDLEPSGRFEVRMGSLTVAADGTISGNMGGAFTGRTTTGVNGTVSVHVDTAPPDPGFDLQFVVNASKDIMAGQATGDEGEQELILFIRTPAGLSNELKGLWRAADFAVPTELTLQTNAVGEVFGLDGARDFEIWHDAVSVGHQGALIGLTEPMVGQVTLGSAGLVRMSGTNGEGDSFTKDFWSNAGQDLLVSTETVEHQELTLALRTPSSPAAETIASKIRWRRQGECLELFWASDTNRV
ncbi:MAG: hypothetical protein KJ072_23685, partial [Verrucomicrobia bacterium]|nr:hypothetical protein [Verrucomicrobiota bacterium]